MKKKPHYIHDGIAIVQGEYGQFFFNCNLELITYIHENDAQLRMEYMKPLFDSVGCPIYDLDMKKLDKFDQDVVKKIVNEYEPNDT